MSDKKEDTKDQKIRIGLNVDSSKIKLSLPTGAIKLSLDGKTSTQISQSKKGFSPAVGGGVTVVTKKKTFTSNSAQDGRADNVAEKHLTQSEQESRLSALMKAQSGDEDQMKIKFYAPSKQNRAPFDDNSRGSTNSRNRDENFDKQSRGASTGSADGEKNGGSSAGLFMNSVSYNFDNTHLIQNLDREIPKPKKPDLKPFSTVQKKETAVQKANELEEASPAVKAKTQKEQFRTFRKQDAVKLLSELEDEECDVKDIDITSFLFGSKNEEDDEDDGTGITIKKAAVKTAINRRHVPKRRKGQKVVHQQVAKIIRDVELPELITVKNLADQMAEKSADVIKCLMNLGVMASINKTIDAETAELVISEFGHRFKKVFASAIEDNLKVLQEKPENLVAISPIVTVMGHVDHGKTSLLDAIRQTDVAAGESGGITQHIGAYRVVLNSGKSITFIDTPGHEAFTQMRSRGAKVTDIVILVVAADDGIQQQTIEAISHAKAANVPIVVAINKIDKPDANINKIKEELLKHDLISEDYGGEVIMVPVSAKTKENIDKLEEAVLLQAEILDLKANPNAPASGVVVESKLDKGRGPLCTLLVKRGTLKQKDIIVVGTFGGKVRTMSNHKMEQLTLAEPSWPVEVTGLDGVPDAGDSFYVVESEQKMRELIEYKKAQATSTPGCVEAAKTEVQDIFANAAANASKKTIFAIIKTDVQGSCEAISATIAKMNTQEVEVKVIHSGVGGINASDVNLAKASNAVVFGFNVRSNPDAKDFASKEKVDVRYYSIIYDIVDDIKALMSGMLSPVKREEYLGIIEIREVFNMSKYGKVAGCYVTEGCVKRDAKIRLLRDNVVIHNGEVKTLKRFKEDVKEVKSGFECGIQFERYEDIRVGDKIEAYEIITTTRQI